MWMIIGCNFFAPLGGRKGLGGHPSGAPAVRMASIMRSRCARNTGLSLSPKARTLPIDEILLFGIAAEVVANMYADAEFYALLRQNTGVALDHGALDFDCAAHGVDHAAEFDDKAVAGALDGAPMMGGNGRLDQIAAKASEPCERAILVGASEPAVADDIRHQDRRELSTLAHCVLR